MVLAVKQVENEKEANAWLLRLKNQIDNFKNVFVDEAKSLTPQASQQRLCYIVEADGVPVLYSAINKDSCDISSFAKLVDKNRSNVRGRECVKVLIEDVVVAKCRHLQKAFFRVCVISEKGNEVIDYLINNLPSGIQRIEKESEGNSQLWSKQEQKILSSPYVVYRMDICM